MHVLRADTDPSLNLGIALAKFHEEVANALSDLKEVRGCATWLIPFSFPAAFPSVPIHARLVSVYSSPSLIALVPSRFEIFSD